MLSVGLRVMLLKGLGVGIAILASHNIFLRPYVNKVWKGLIGSMRSLDVDLYSSCTVPSEGGDVDLTITAGTSKPAKHPRILN